MSLSRYAHLASFATGTPWALVPDMAQLIVRILAERISGERADPAVIAAAVAVRKDNAPIKRGGVAVIPINGVLAPRANMLTESSGGTSYDAVGAAFAEALDHPEVDTIVLDVDSPGGSVAGTTELAAKIRAGRARKPVIAVANHEANSAAYRLASSATKIYASPSARVGSIGVLSIRDDLTEALAKEGIKREYIHAGKYKLDGAAQGPLSDQGRAHAQELVSAFYGYFVDDVAKGRNVKRADVINGFGEGRSLCVEAALAAGMIDAIDTLDNVLLRLLPVNTTADARVFGRAADTPQEPLAATGQDQPSDVDWRARAERDLLKLTLP